MQRGKELSYVASFRAGISTQVLFLRLCPLVYSVLFTTQRKVYLSLQEVSSPVDESVAYTGHFQQ